MKDSCSNISAMSLYHQSLYIQNVIGNFSWNHYQIEGQPTPVTELSNYVFQRDNLSDGNWLTIQTLSASSLAYTDPQYSTFQNTAQWRVQTAWTIICNPTKTILAKIKKTVSNSLRVADPHGVKEYYNNPSINIAPNPFSESTMLRIANVNRNTNYELKVYSIYGTEVLANIVRNPNGFVISRGALSNGMYFYKLMDKSNIISTGKLIIE